MSSILAAVLVCLQTPPPAPSAVRGSTNRPVLRDPNIYFVDPVRGHDVGNGRSPSSPWRTLTFALPRAGGGPGTVMMAPGEYSEASGEHFPLPALPQLQLVGELARGARIRGPVSGAVPVFQFTAALQTFVGIEIVSEGVAFDLTYAPSLASRQQGIPAMDIGADIKARRAVDVHLQAVPFGAYLGISGSLASEQAAITVDGTWSSAQNFELHLGSAVMRAGPGSAAVDVRAGGGGRVAVFCRNAALHASGAGLWLRPQTPLDVSLEIDSCVFHALGNSSLSGGPLVVEGTGARDIAIRRSIFWNNYRALDLPDYDAATYVLERNLVQQASLVGVGGNITGDPRFVEAASGDFHLRPDSPARGAGIGATTAYDLENDPRGSGPDDAMTDLGVDEFYPRYHWYRPPPRVGAPTLLRILGEPGDLAMAFASPATGVASFPSVGIGWQLGALLSPRPFAVALIGPDGLAEVPLSLPRGLSDRRLRSRGIMTQIRYLTPQGATEFSANAVVVPLVR